MRKLNRNIILVIALFCFLKINGQTVLIKQTIPEDFSEIDKNKGPNRNQFSYPYFGIGFHSEGFSHENDTIISPKYFSSLELKFGTRLRFKIHKVLAYGLDLELNYASHKVNLKDAYALANYSPDVKKAKYQLYRFGSTNYLQFNFEPKRGNQLGSYLDIGAFGYFNFSRRYTQTLETVDKQKSKYILKNLQDFEKWEYGALIRFGKNVWTIYAKYRYSNSFKNKATIGNYELPRLTFGFEYFMGNV